MAILSDRTITSSSGLSSRKYRNQTATSDSGHFCAEVPKSLHIGAYLAELFDAEQAWFWTREWQDREREADEDLAAGRVTRFESDEDFLAELDGKEREKWDKKNL